MRIKDGFEMCEIGGDHVVVACGMQNIDFSKVIDMNESAALLWDALLGKDFDLKDMAHVLTEEYEVDEETATRDAAKLIDNWKKIGLLE